MINFRLQLGSIRAQTGNKAVKPAQKCLLDVIVLKSSPILPYLGY